MLQDLEMEEEFKRGVAEGRGEFIQHLHAAEAAAAIATRKEATAQV